MDTTLSHWTTQIGQECTLKLISAPRRRRFWIEHDTSNLCECRRPRRPTICKNGGFYSALPNEARRVINMPPREGGDEYGNPGDQFAGSRTATTAQDSPQTDAKQAETAALSSLLGLPPGTSQK